MDCTFSFDFYISFRHLMKTGKITNQTITTMWKTVLKCLFYGGGKEENGMIFTVKTKKTGFARFEEVKRPFTLMKMAKKKF